MTQPGIPLVILRLPLRVTGSESESDLSHSAGYVDFHAREEEDDQTDAQASSRLKMQA
jgi:hypothetical protein